MTNTLENLIKPDNTHEKNELLKKSEISLWIDTYDDIFSDFDPRPFSQRALSQDFLLEAKRASRDLETGKIQIGFLVPAEIQNIKTESAIKKRLLEHFKKHYEEKKKEKKGIVFEGILFVLMGIITMIFASYILFSIEQQTFYSHLGIIILEPAGWFLFWEGLNRIVFDSRTKNEDLKFYQKLSDCEISFTSY